MPSERSSRSDIAERILEHATKLFAARGFVGASLRDIARAVGIRKPSLLYHFPSKDDLRRRVLEQMLSHWNDVVPRILRAATSGQEQFDAIARETIAFFSENPDRARLLLRELLDRPEEMRPLIELHVEPWARIVCDYIRKGQEQGRVHPDVDPEAYVVQIINLVLCGIAITESIGKMLPEGAAAEGCAISQRHLSEMMRVAKSSLFITPQSETAGARPPAAEAG
jgi:TetR/AcrR family transcriptional regulator